MQAAVPGGPDAPRRARTWVRGELGGRVPGAVLENVVLIVTELVANAVRHGGADAASELHLGFELRRTGLRVEVTDPGKRSAGVAPRRLDPSTDGGFGLHIVERLSTRWGVGDGPRTSVWFEVALS